MYTSVSEQIKRQKQRKYGETGAASLREYLKGAWFDIEGNKPLYWNRHIDVIAEHLEAVITGQIKRLVIAIPPRHLKSTLISVAFPTWAWINSPHIRFLTTSYSSSLATRDSQRSRQLIEGQWYQEHYGANFQMLHDVNMKSYYKNDRGGFRLATSVQGSTTGEGGDIILGDDMLNIADAYSDAARERSIDYWKNTIRSRLNDQENGALVLIGQRVHENDVIGYALSTGSYEAVILPAEFEPATCFHTVLGCDWRTEEKEPLWKERMGSAALAEIKQDMGTEYFTQYQQSPMKEGGNILKAHYFKRYSLSPDGIITLHKDGYDEEVPMSACTVVVTSDLATGKKQENDYTAIGIWLLTGKYEAILWDVFHDKIDGPEGEKQIDRYARQYKRRLLALVMEDVGHQKDAIQRQQQKGWPVIAYHPLVDKVARAHSFAVYMRQGSVFWPLHDTPWKAELERELVTFPRSSNDDRVDMCTILIALFGDMPAITILEEERAAPPAIVQEIPELREMYETEEEQENATIGSYS